MDPTTTTPTRSAGPRHPHIRRSVPALVLAGAGAVITWYSDQFRTFEAIGGGLLTGLATRAHTVIVAATHTFYWSGGRGSIAGLTVTADCSSALVAGPILIAAGVLTVVGRLPARRVMAAGLLAAFVAVAINVVRLGLIGWATFHWQLAGFDWTHVVIGSLMTVAGAFIAILIFAWVAFGLGAHDPGRS